MFRETRHLAKLAAERIGSSRDTGVPHPRFAHHELCVCGHRKIDHRGKTCQGGCELCDDAHCRRYKRISSLSSVPVPVIRNEVDDE